MKTESNRMTKQRKPRQCKCGESLRFRKKGLKVCSAECANTKPASQPTGIAKVCVQCESGLPRLKRKYCSPSCEREYNKPKAAKYRYVAAENVKEFREHFKQKGCGVCDYKKCLSALEFHHVNGKGASITSLRSIRQIEKEFEEYPVVILCANCHREVHYGLAVVSEEMRL